MNTKLGYELRHLRRAAGLTRFEVAKSTGYSISYIIAIEQGGPVSDNAIADLLKCYGTTLGEQPISACIRDAVDDYDDAMAVGDLSGAEIV